MCHSPPGPRTAWRSAHGAVWDDQLGTGQSGRDACRGKRRDGTVSGPGCGEPLSRFLGDQFSVRIRHRQPSLYIKGPAHYVDLLRNEEPEKRLLRLTGLYYASARNFVLSRGAAGSAGRAKRAALLSADTEAWRPPSVIPLTKEDDRMSEKKKAIVVGVGAEVGVGGAVCHRLAREGLHVFIAGRTQEKLDHSRAEHSDQRWNRDRSGDGYDSGAGCSPSV